jgi:Zn-dependent protease
MVETETAAPWGPRPDAAAPPAPPESPAAPAAPRPSKLPAAARPPKLNEYLWGALSTLLLAGFVGLQLGWLAAFAIVAGVFVHEFGHVLVINWAGSGPSSIRIIPFLGGAATMKRAPDTDFKGVLIALAGPAMGLVAAAPFFALAAATGERGWLAGAFYVGLLNFINLAPAPPLDGSKALGPVLGRIHPALERAALLLVGVLAAAWGFSRGSYIFAVFIAISVIGAAMRPMLRPPARPLGLGEWVASLALYLGVLAAAAAVILVSLDAAPGRLIAFIRGGG